MVTVWPSAMVATPMSSLQSLTIYSRPSMLSPSPAGRRGGRSSTAAYHAQLLPPLAFFQGVVIQHDGDGLAVDLVLLTELGEVEKHEAAVVSDHFLEVESH